ncbi:DUF4129 domain-containing transglutaminase family protein [Paenibacillus gansuensis]|uniref:DUF4129 domain-containing transglutaminase family protein n=1 Tax=Paenibacillus gansuensis TaxID=306542 RepID=A0ABW5PBH4_9BACL
MNVIIPEETPRAPRLAGSVWSRPWPHILYALFIGLILQQFIIWFDEYWLKDTVKLASIALGITFIVELIYVLPVTVRLLLQLAGITAAHTLVLEGFIPLNADTGGTAGFLDILWYDLKLFDPYIWYVLAVWIIYAMLLRGLTTLYRVFCLLLFSIFSFSVMDSFSPLILWDQIAVILGSGLCLLIVRNYAEIERKHPASWRSMRRKPVRVLLPIVVTAGAVFAVGLTAPEWKPMVTDPYTAWKNSIGEPVSVKGKGGEDGDEDKKDSDSPKNAKSGYSRNDEKLGGGFDYSFTPVMTVDTSRKSYWRGETKSLYTGRGWKRGEEEGAPSQEAGYNQILKPFPGFDDSKLETEEVTQVFRMQKPHKPILFAAKGLEMIVDEQVKDAESVNSGHASASNGNITWVPREEELRWYDAGYPNSYTVVSRIPVIDEEALRKVPKTAGPAMQDYLELPPTLPDRVRALAQDIVKDAANPYDQAKAIESYLNLTYPYNPKPDVSKAGSYDFVDGFLFEIKEGYCDYYSTAMAVLARSIGLPSRWVKGYTAGEQPLDNFDYRGGMPPEAIMEQLEGPGTYTVRNSDAHSWVEIYFEGYGWIPFEPTAGFTMPLLAPEGEQLEQSETKAPDPAVPAAEDASSWPKATFIVSAIIVVFLAAAAVAAYLYKEAIADRVDRWRGRTPDRANQRLVAEFERYLRYARRKGLTRGEHETARETITRWSREYSWLQQDLAALLGLFEKAKYSPALLSEEELQGGLARIQSLRAALK